MEHIVIREKDIRKAHNPPAGFSEEFIRSVLEKSGIDFGRTTFCRGVSPDREWTNGREMFMPSDEEMAAVKAEQDAEAAILEAEKARAAAENARKDREISDLRAQLELLSQKFTTSAPSVEESVPEKPRSTLVQYDPTKDKRTKEYKAQTA